MKSFKLTLLAMTAIFFLQGCDDDSDESTTPLPNQPNIDTEIVGTWSNDDSSSGLSTIVFMDDETYVQVQVNSSQSTSDPENGMEWGNYNINNSTGKLTATPIFDKNGSSGLSDSVNRHAQVSNGKLILEVDENNDGIIDSDESHEFSKTQPEGILGSWSFDDTDDDELIGLAFFDNGTYVHVQVDKAGSVNNSENGMEWGNYTVDPTTGRLATSMLYDDNGGTGLSEPRTRYARVTGDTALTIEADNDQNGSIDSGESFVFSRPS